MDGAPAQAGGLGELVEGVGVGIIPMADGQGAMGEQLDQDFGGVVVGEGVGAAGGGVVELVEVVGVGEGGGRRGFEI